MIRTLIMFTVDAWLIVGLIVTAFVVFLDDVNLTDYVIDGVDKAAAEIGMTLSRKAGAALAILTLLIAIEITVFTWPKAIKDVKRIVRKRKNRNNK